MQDSIYIRSFLASDSQVVADIYSHHVLTGTATFEELPPIAENMHSRLSGLQGTGFPVLVASDLSGDVVGYAYAGPYNMRSAYRFTVEDSVYVRNDQQRNGIGRALLTALIEQCCKREYKQVLAVIGDSENHGSIALHSSCGFVHVGIARSLGFKFDRWLDVVYMQLSLTDFNSP